MKKMSKRWVFVSASAAALAGGAFFAGQALADGIPDSEALTYSGMLTDDSGDPLTGDHDIEVRFWDAATAGNSLCTSGEETVTLTLGRFSIPLPDACTDEVKAEPDVWVEVVVDSVSLGRAKTGAVPYAVEADHATTADHATSADSATSADHADDADHATTADSADSATNVVVHIDGNGRRICTGVAPADGWSVYNTSWITRVVDTSACGFASTPGYFTTLNGETGHWLVTGMTSIYDPSATQFQIYLYSVSEASLSPATANTRGYSLNWMAVGE